MTTASMRLRTIPSPELAALGFTATREVEYISPTHRADGTTCKPSGHYPGYSEVRDSHTGKVSNLRNDMIAIIRGGSAEDVTP